MEFKSRLPIYTLKYDVCFYWFHSTSIDQVSIFSAKCLKMKFVIDVQNFKIDAQVGIYSVTDLSVSHCLKSSFFEGKCDRCLIFTFLKCSCLNLLHSESESKIYLIQMINVLDQYFILKLLLQEFRPVCYERRSILHNDVCLDPKECQTNQHISLKFQKILCI